MNNEQLQRMLRLLRRTGDRGLIPDNESDEIFVLMNADAYEGMLDKSESGVKPDDFQNLDDLDDYSLDEILEAEEKRSEEENRLYSEFVRSASQKNPKPFAKPIFQPKKKLDFSENWTEKQPSSLINEESLSDVPDDGEEEEKFYLEPVE